MTKYHRHIGVYGICKKDNALLVVEKARGPYKFRYDLPGGSIEENESVIEAIKREFEEETGLDIVVGKNLGFTEYIVPYSISNKDYVQHLALFLEVNAISQLYEVKPSDDTSGAKWMNMEELHADNSSPLVMTALDILATNENREISIIYDEWLTKQSKND